MKTSLNSPTSSNKLTMASVGRPALRSAAFPIAVTGLRRTSLARRIAAQADGKQDKGGLGLYAPESKITSRNGADSANMQTGVELEQAIGQLPAEQQQQLGRLYMFLTQHPEAKVKLQNFGDVRRALDNYQVLLWRPAELLNGRLAMIGFTAAIANEAITGASLWQQLYFAPYAYLSAYLLVVAAAQLNRAFGSPNKGIGPFTRSAELINGRAAMVGYAILAYVEYNQELRRAAFLVYQRLQQQGGVGL